MLFRNSQNLALVLVVAELQGGTYNNPHLQNWVVDCIARWRHFVLFDEYRVNGCVPNQNGVEVCPKSHWFLRFEDAGSQTLWLVFEPLCMTVHKMCTGIFSGEILNLLPAQTPSDCLYALALHEATFYEFREQSHSLYFRLHAPEL